jgi:hypothetical protein
MHEQWMLIAEALAREGSWSVSLTMTEAQRRVIARG